MKKLLSTLLLCVFLLFVFVCIASFITGKRVHEALDQQLKIWQESNLIEVVSRDYQSGFFHSKEIMVLRARSALLNQLGDALPEQVNLFLSEPITLENDIWQAPILSGRLLGANVQTQFKFTEKSGKIIKQIFADEQPFDLVNNIHWNLAGQLKFTVKPIDYEELSGIKIKWSGLQGVVDYTKDYRQYETDIRTKQLHIDLAKKANLQLENLHYRSNNDNDISPLTIGDNRFTVDLFKINWLEKFNTQLQLNELVKLMTDLQLGGFMSPSLTFPPSGIIIHSFEFKSGISAQGENVNTTGQLSFKEMDYGETKYGPFTLELQGSHLNAQGLMAFKNKMSALAKQNLSAQEWQEEALSAIKQDGVAVLVNNPEFSIKTFKLNTPEGLVDIEGKVSLLDLTNDDLNDFSSLVNKTLASLKFSIPEHWFIEQLADYTLHSFTTDDDVENVDMEAVHASIYGMISSTINNMLNQGHMSKKDHYLQGKIDLKSGYLYMNDKLIDLNEDKEVMEMLDDNSNFLDSE